MQTMYEQTLAMLRQTNTPVRKIAADTDLSVRWLYYLRDGGFEDPSVRRIERLHSYLLAEQGDSQ